VVSSAPDGVKVWSALTGVLLRSWHVTDSPGKSAYPLLPLQVSLSPDDYFLTAQTASGIFLYDFNRTVEEDATQGWWETITGKELIGDFKISWTKLRQGRPDNVGYVAYNASFGSLDFLPCLPVEGLKSMTADLSELSCASPPPVLGVDIVLPFSFIKVRGLKPGACAIEPPPGPKGACAIEPPPVDPRERAPSSHLRAQRERVPTSHLR